jgi:hypothetical protein
MFLRATNHYLDIPAMKANVLVDELQAVADPPSVPELSSYALFLVGMLGLAGVSAPKRLAAQKA